jgi:hypothetical protein
VKEGDYAKRLDIGRGSPVWHGILTYGPAQRDSRELRAVRAQREKLPRSGTRARLSSPATMRLLSVIAGLLLAASFADAARTGADADAEILARGTSSGKIARRKPRKPSLCQGHSCLSMSNLLPQMRLADASKPLQCACAEFSAGRCFAPGCFPCAPSCFAGNSELLRNPGPFGTGLLCSAGCLPCCQAADASSRASNSTCELPKGGCF